MQTPFIYLTWKFLTAPASENGGSGGPMIYREEAFWRLRQFSAETGHLRPVAASISAVKWRPAKKLIPESTGLTDTVERRLTSMAAGLLASRIRLRNSLVVWPDCAKKYKLRKYRPANARSRLTWYVTVWNYSEETSSMWQYTIVDCSGQRRPNWWWWLKYQFVQWSLLW